MDIFYSGFSLKAKLLIDRASALLTVIIALLVIWLSLKYVGQSYAINEQSPDPGGLQYRWALKALLPIGYTLLLLQGVGQLLRLRKVRHV